MKKLNRLLNFLFGLNLVHAKRKAPRRVKEAVPECVRANVSDYVGDAEWHQNTGIGYKAKRVVVNPDVMFVPVDQPRVEQPNSKNDITGPAS